MSAVAVIILGVLIYQPYTADGPRAKHVHKDTYQMSDDNGKEQHPDDGFKRLSRCGENPKIE